MDMQAMDMRFGVRIPGAGAAPGGRRKVGADSDQSSSFFNPFLYPPFPPPPSPYRTSFSVRIPLPEVSVCYRSPRKVTMHRTV